MDFRIDYDPEAFLGGEGPGDADPVPDAIGRGMAAIADRLQAALDEVFESHSGRPADEVAEEVRRITAEHGFELAEDDVSVSAETIAGGRRMSVSVGYR